MELVDGFHVLLLFTAAEMKRVRGISRFFAVSSVDQRAPVNHQNAVECEVGEPPEVGESGHGIAAHRHGLRWPQNSGRWPQISSRGAGSSHLSGRTSH